MEYPIEIALKRPVMIEGVEYAALRFDEPDVATSIAVSQAETPEEQTVVLLAGMAEVDRAVILKLKKRDFDEIQRRLDGFMEAGAEAIPPGKRKR